MKKMISLVLCALMAASLCLTAFAVDAPGGEAGIDPQSSCPHTERISMDASVDKGTFVNQGDGTCANPSFNKEKCTACGKIFFAYTPIYVNATAHSGSPYQASCNGTTQTWHCNCGRCGAYYVETHTCYAPSHKNGCPALPV